MQSLTVYVWIHNLQGMQRLNYISLFKESQEGLMILINDAIRQEMCGLLQGNYAARSLSFSDYTFVHYLEVMNAKKWMCCQITWWDKENTRTHTHFRFFCVEDLYLSHYTSCFRTYFQMNQQLVVCRGVWICSWACHTSVCCMDAPIQLTNYVSATILDPTDWNWYRLWPI